MYSRGGYCVLNVSTIQNHYIVRVGSLQAYFIVNICKQYVIYFKTCWTLQVAIPCNVIPNWTCWWLPTWIYQKETKPSPKTMKQKDQCLSVLRSKRLDPLNPLASPEPGRKKQSLISVYLLPRKIFPTRPDKSSIKTFKPTIAHPICLMKSYFSVPTCPNQKKWLFQINFPRLTCFHAWCPWPTGLLRTTWTTLGRAPLGDLALGLGLWKSRSWERDNEGSTSARPGSEKT